MAYLNNVRDGRQSKVYLLSFGSTEKTALESGKMYAVTGVAESSTKLGDLKKGDIFVAIADESSLTNGDKVVEVTPKFLGGATDKDISFEKSTTEITCDKDDASNSVTDGKVTVSGSVTCYDLIESDKTSAANSIRSRFNKVITYGESGKAATVTEGDRTAKDVLLFLWDARDLDTDEYVAMDVVPALITSQAHSSSYGSGQTFSINFTGTDTDEVGHRRSYHQFQYFEEFGTFMSL